MHLRYQYINFDLGYSDKTVYSKRNIFHINCYLTDSGKVIKTFKHFSFFYLMHHFPKFEL